MSQPGRIIVTGAGGFVGRHLLTELRAAFPTATLVAAVRPEGGIPPVLEAADQIVPFDLLAPEAMAAMIEAVQPEGLVHLAAQSSVAASFADPAGSWRSNLLGTIGLAEAVLKQAPACRFVLASSAEIYGLSFKAAEPLDEAAPLLPANPYAASKAACDLAIGEMSLRGLDSVRLRAFNHTGAGQSGNFVIAAFARQIARIEAGLQPPLLRVGALNRWRDFLDVRDVCRAYVAALRLPETPGAVFNIASGTPRRIADILESMLNLSTMRPRVEVELSRLRPTDVERVAGDATRAHSVLGWRPTVPWDETLNTVMADWRQRSGDQA